MKPAMCAAIDYDFPFNQVVPLIRQVGFEIISLGALPEHSGYATVAGRASIRRLMDENGLRINSVHSSPKAWQLFSANDGQRQEAVAECKVAIDAAFELDADIVVLHTKINGSIGETRRETVKAGVESVGLLSDYSRKRGIKLALENLTRAGDTPLLELLLTEYRDQSVGLCYDSGHEHLAGTGFDCLEKFGDRLLTTHICDNWGEIDNHSLPYEGHIDWDRFKNIFHSLDYAGDLLLEPMLVHSQFKDPATFLAEGLIRAERLMEPPG